MVPVETAGRGEYVGDSVTVKQSAPLTLPIHRGANVLTRLRNWWWSRHHHVFDWHEDAPELKEPSHVRVTRYPPTSTLKESRP